MRLPPFTAVQQFRLLAVLAVLITALSLPFAAPDRSASAQTVGLKLPAEAGSVWEVLAGYNTVTHEGVDPYALDLWRIGGSTGGSALLAPMNGEIGYLSDDCLSIRTAEVNLLMCHVFPSPDLQRGTPVVTGQMLGIVAPDGQANNNGIAHIHLQLNLRNAAGRTGEPLPFVGPFAIEGREFPATTAPNAYYGERVTSTNQVVAGGTPLANGPPTMTVDSARTATPGEVVTLTASATAASTITWQQTAGTTVLPGALSGTAVTFNAPHDGAWPLQFLVVAEGQGGVSTAQVTVDVAAVQPEPVRVVYGDVHPQGVSLIVFGGGTADELVSAVTCPGILSIWASGTDGGFIRYSSGAPDFVNASWHQRFPGGLPELTPLLINCQ